MEAGVHPELHPGAEDRPPGNLDTRCMTITGYLMNIALIGLVVLQVRGHKVTKARMLLPVVLTLWAGSLFLHGIPTLGNDLVLESGLAVTGAALGLAAGLTTAVRRVGADAFAKAGAVAAVLWVAGVGARMAFSFWVGHGGHASIAAFSAQHGITSGSAWVAGFILMAMLEVVVRTGVLYVKAVRTGAAIPRGGIRHYLAAS